jgi:D-aminopeptidase
MAADRRARRPTPRGRARDAGVAIGRFAPGPRNAITDVAGVRVGHVTRVEGSGALVPGAGPIRTGVTAVFPAAGDVLLERVFAGSAVLNGAGEVVGLAQLDEWGLLETPVVLCSTLCVGRVFDATVAWLSRRHPRIGGELDVVIPVVGECDDSFLNDAVGRHVRPEDVWTALDQARGGPVAEGNVGAGAGMQTFGFAGGIGTSSRRLALAGARRTVGALVLSNFGEREHLRLDGVPVGRLLGPRFDPPVRRGPAGSIIVLVATDVPLHPLQLSRVARRAALAIGRAGGHAPNNSGEIVVAWSTGNRVPRGRAARPVSIEVVLDGELDALFEATIDVVEEAIANAVFAGVETRGHGDHVAPALPIAAARAALRRHLPPRA